jgi:hypothetical protein
VDPKENSATPTGTARPLNTKPLPAEALAKEGKYQSKVKGKKVKG